MEVFTIAHNYVCLHVMSVYVTYIRNEGSKSTEQKA